MTRRGLEAVDRQLSAGSWLVVFVILFDVGLAAGGGYPGCGFGVWEEGLWEVQFVYLGKEGTQRRKANFKRREEREQMPWVYMR